MSNLVRILAGLLLSLLLSLSACTDHRLNEPGQPRLRLKRTISTSPGFPGTTEFVYDPQGRQAAYVYLGDRATFSYDANNRVSNILFPYVTTVDITGEQTVFTYDDAQRQVRATNSLLITVNGQYTPRNPIKTSVYNFDTQNLPTSLVESTPISTIVATTEFSFSAGNLARTVSQSTASANRTASDYSYDSHPNPFFGLIGPGVTDARRFSRNNVVKLTTTTNLGTPTQSQPQDQYTIQYEYNAQGLPIRAITSNTELRFEYESY